MDNKSIIEKYMPIYTHNIKAVELFSVAWCNLDCKYCYIPKNNKMMRELQKQVIDNLHSDEVLDRLEQFFGKDNVQHMTHWGTEPTLVLKDLEPFYDRAFKRFPNLVHFFISTNMMTPPEKLADFIVNVLEKSPNVLDVGIQWSLDGPPWITDINRRGGAAKKIGDNCVKLVELLNKHKLKNKIKCHFKSTISPENMAILQDYEKTKEYYIFFDEIFERIFLSNINNNVSVGPDCNPTYIMPGNYTKQDGINFYKFYLNQMKLRESNIIKFSNIESTYYQRFVRIFKFYNELYTKRTMFTCSAGDSCFGFGQDNSLHICHRSFYFDYPGYDEIQLNDHTRLYDESENVTQHKYDVLRSYITNIDDSKKLLNIMMRYRSVHDFVRHHLGCLTNICVEMAYAGQIDETFKDPNHSILLSILLSNISCPAEDIIGNGSINIPSASFIRLYGNGLAQAFFKRALVEMRGFLPSKDK